MSDITRQKVKKAGFHYEGRRVVVNDIKNLQVIANKGAFLNEDELKNYVEPVYVEYYVPQEIHFIKKTLYLYIPLIDPIPKDNHKLLKRHMEKNKFFDLIQIMEKYSEYKEEIEKNYREQLPIYRNLSEIIQQAEQGEGNVESLYRRSFYFCEVLAAYEPRLFSLEVLGDFHAWNLNYLTHILNKNRFQFSASDTTVAYFIKKRNEKWEREKKKEDPGFNILVALFQEQAFPGRSNLL